MNTKIFKLIKENLDTAFNLPKYAKIRDSINADTLVDQLPWTPARYRKFKDAVDAEGNPIYQGIDTSFLVATLTAAIQEQQTIINDLKTRIETLEGAKLG